jgi:hypothetical protein
MSKQSAASGRGRLRAKVGGIFKRTDRPVGIGLKISKEKRRQFDRLRVMTRLSYTEILEQALDAFEAQWNARHK